MNQTTKQNNNNELDQSLAIFFTTIVSDLVDKGKPVLFLDGIQTDYERVRQAYGSLAIKLKIMVSVKKKGANGWVLVAKKTENIL